MSNFVRVDKIEKTINGQKAKTEYINLDWVVKFRIRPNVDDHSFVTEVTFADGYKSIKEDYTGESYASLLYAVGGENDE